MALEMSGYAYSKPEVDGSTALCRVDSGVVEGSEISQHYDPMISKLITYADVSTLCAGAGAALRFLRREVPPQPWRLQGFPHLWFVAVTLTRECIYLPHVHRPVNTPWMLCDGLSAPTLFEVCCWTVKQMYSRSVGSVDLARVARHVVTLSRSPPQYPLAVRYRR
jgi:hypothetical protein